eukprot:TRINITY_DN860_c0_g1_i1.p1 TRINITY_DN860_c0_g1~~TRINITY_DN860_c0_g1_i1.p1  ORF type:complete len:535 (+),score=65.45 TRINITY_DN860_c0_g1_i1:32-1636(+)
MNAARVTKRIIFGDHTGTEDIPASFNVYAERVKDLSRFLVDLEKHVGKYAKAMHLHCTSGTSLAEYLVEIQNRQEFPNDGSLLAEMLAHIASVHKETCYLFIENKRRLAPTILDPIQEFSTRCVTPAIEARKKWSLTRNELNSAIIAVEQITELMKFNTNTGKSVVIRQLLGAQEEQARVRRKEQFLFERAIEELSWCMWQRDASHLLSLTGMITELHDVYLDAYQVVNSKLPAVEAMKREITVGKQNMEEKRRMREQNQRHEAQRAEEGKFDGLVRILSAEDLILISAIGACAGGDQFEMLRSIIMILDAHKKTLSLIKLGIVGEVNNTFDATTLFRGNSVSTKMMTAYTKMTGAQYMKIILPALNKLLQDPEGFEIDPTKMREGENVASNAKKLDDMCQLFLDTIISTVSSCPLAFREMANTLQTEVLKRFSDSRYTSVGGFIFLRFFCPTISSPDANGLCTSVSKDARRVLVLVSKVLQTLANGLTFGFKEQYLVCMNDFIERNLERTQLFLDTVAVSFSQSFPVLISTCL